MLAQEAAAMAALPADPRTHPENASLPVANRPETILGVTITFLIIAMAAASLRLFVRFKERLWGWDDVCVFIAAVAVSIGSGLTCLMPDDGLGMHFWTLRPALRINYFKHIWATNVAYNFATTFIKLAILLQYLRLFRGQNEVARRLTLGLLCFAAAWGISFTLLALFSCSPVEKNWNFTLPGKCVAWGSKDPNVFFASWVSHAASNMFFDILILLLPIPFVSGLKASGKTRLGLIALFCVGTVVVMLSTVRVVALSKNRAGTVPIFDPSFHTPVVYIFSVLEVDVAILCASTPIFWPLVTSLGLNKILIVNEITVRTERRSEHIDLIDSSKGGDFGDGEDGRTSRISVLANRPELDKAHYSPSRIARSLSRQHRHKPSNSSHKAIGIHIGSRPSQDSQRDLQLSESTSNNSLSSLARPDQSLAPCADGTVARYADKYMQELAVPDFDRTAPPDVRPAYKQQPSNTRQTYTTTVGRAQVPYDHIRALEK